MSIDARGAVPSNPPATTTRLSYVSAAAWPVRADVSDDADAVNVPPLVYRSNSSIDAIGAPALSPPAITIRPSYRAVAV